MKSKDLNKKLRELRERNKPIKKNEIFIPEVGDIISVYGVRYQCTDNGIGTFFLKMKAPIKSYPVKASEEKAMLNDSGRKTFQEIFSEKMEKIAVLEKEIYKRN